MPEYHRSLRGKDQVHSVLEDIPGVGPARRKALMRSYGTMERLKEATEEELAGIPEMNRASARSVWEFLHRTAENAQENS